jgi:hypothetical protein
MRRGVQGAAEPRRRDTTSSRKAIAEDAVLSLPTAIDSDSLASDPATNAQESGAQQTTESGKEKASRAFYGSVISKELEKMGQYKIRLTPEEEQRALRRALIPHTIERLERESEQAVEETKDLGEELDRVSAQADRLTQLVENQQSELIKLRAPNTERASMLSHVVHDIKLTSRKKGLKLSQATIAFHVDTWLEKRGLKVKEVCPPGWLKTIKIEEFPLLFRDCIKHPKLAGKAKTLITRA